jgi:hypothetical protein
MTRGKVGHYWRRIATDPFVPFAVVMTGGSSYEIPSGATTVEAWAVGAGASGGVNTNLGGGGIAYRSWAIDGQTSVSYSVALSPNIGNADTPQATTVTFSALTISGMSSGGIDGGSASGGSANFRGGDRSFEIINNETYFLGGGAGGNQPTVSPCQRNPGTDVSGLHAALALAGFQSSETCGISPAFGSGASVKFEPSTGGPSLTHRFEAGLGGGGASIMPGGDGAVVLKFT